jgi:hypothetical protein
MLFDDVYLVSKKLVTIPEQEITLLEQQLGVVLPPDYHAYMTRLGRGAYCDTICGGQALTPQPALLRRWERWSNHCLMCSPLPSQRKRGQG